jgi:hypothetical protein
VARSRVTTSSSDEESKSVLPLPKALIEHHLQTLESPMSEWKTQGRIPPVLLLTGVAGLGKREICHFISQWALCEKSGFGSTPSEDLSMSLFGESPSEKLTSEPAPNSVLPCGECSACQKAVHGTWVDFKEIHSEDEEEGGALKIQLFRELKSTMGFGSHEGGYRIILIPDADRMTAQAANSVLKLLEEPPRGWVFLLTASDPTLILPTVLSRCQTLRLRPISEITLETALREDGVEAGRARMAARLAHGSWNKSKSLAQQEVWDRRKMITQFVRSPAANFSDLVDWAASENRHLEMLLDTLEGLLADLLLWSVSERTPQYSWRNADASSDLTAHALDIMNSNRGDARSSRDFWTARAEHIGETRRRMSAPLNRKLLTQVLLMPWLEAKAAAQRI